MINLILLIIAVVLFVLIAPIAFLYTIIKHFWRGVIRFLSPYFWKCALSIDQAGNAVCKEFFNDLLIIDPKPHPFGHENETVSHVLGVNKELKNLTWLGKGLSWILNLLDRGHVEKAAETPQ